MHRTARRPKIVVSADGTGLVSQAGGLLLTQALRAAGLDRGLTVALERWRAPRAVHDPGKIITDLAVTLALGGDCLADIAMLRAEPGLFGPVASDPVVSRLVTSLAADAPRALKAIRAARAVAAARRHELTRAKAIQRYANSTGSAPRSASPLSPPQPGSAGPGSIPSPTSATRSKGCAAPPRKPPRARRSRPASAPPTRRCAVGSPPPSSATASSPPTTPYSGGSSPAPLATSDRPVRIFRVTRNERGGGKASGRDLVCEGLRMLLEASRISASSARPATAARRWPRHGSSPRLILMGVCMPRDERHRGTRPGNGCAVAGQDGWVLVVAGVNRPG